MRKYQALVENIIDVMQEQQLKLGYRKEPVRLYYPAKAVANLLGIRNISSEPKAKEIKMISDDLKGFEKSSNIHMGGIKFSVKDGQFCFLISEEGAEYVNKDLDHMDFIKEFIGVIEKEGCTLEDIKAVFAKYSDNYICKKFENSEFDYLLMFPDGEPSKYRYCIKFENNKAIYHRFTKLDFEDMFGK